MSIRAFPRAHGLVHANAPVIKEGEIDLEPDVPGLQLDCTVSDFRYRGTDQEEETILGTGGGLRKALAHFGKEPVLVVNGDIYHSIDYREVFRFHYDSSADVTLVLHDYPRFNDVSVDDELGITGFNKALGDKLQIGKMLAFTGIHVINPQVLLSIPQETNYCIIDCYKKLLAQGGTLKAFLARNHFWTDMGTPADYLKLHGDLLNNKVPVYEELSDIAFDAPFVGTKTASIAGDAKLLDWVCMNRGVRIEAGASLQRTVVWEDAVVPAGSIIKDAIITQ